MGVTLPFPWIGIAATINKPILHSYQTCSVIVYMRMRKGSTGPDQQNDHQPTSVYSLPISVLCTES